jgi:hypothetical protein
MTDTEKRFMSLSPCVAAVEKPVFRSHRKWPQSLGRGLGLRRSIGPSRILDGEKKKRNQSKNPFFIIVSVDAV